MRVNQSMTRQDVAEILDAVSHKGLFSAIVFHGTIFGTVDERHIYADSNAEVLFWAELMNQTYNKALTQSCDPKLQKIPYSIYVNEELKYQEGDWDPFFE